MSSRSSLLGCVRSSPGIRTRAPRPSSPAAAQPQGLEIEGFHLVTANARALRPRLDAVPTPRRPHRLSVSQQSSDAVEQLRSPIRSYRFLRDTVSWTFGSRAISTAWLRRELTTNALDPPTRIQKGKVTKPNPDLKAASPGDSYEVVVQPSANRRNMPGAQNDPRTPKSQLSGRARTSPAAGVSDSRPPAAQGTRMSWARSDSAPACPRPILSRFVGRG
jgi:hypothetical protein